MIFIEITLIIKQAIQLPESQDSSQEYNWSIYERHQNFLNHETWCKKEIPSDQMHMVFKSPSFIHCYYSLNSYLMWSGLLGRGGSFLGLLGLPNSGLAVLYAWLPRIRLPLCCTRYGSNAGVRRCAPQPPGVDTWRVADWPTSVVTATQPAEWRHENITGSLQYQCDFLMQNDYPSANMMEIFPFDLQ